MICMKTLIGKIAIVGLSGIFPGAGDGNLSQFCRNIMEKREAVCDVPPDRWTLPQEAIVSSDDQPDSACSNRAGMITGFQFDPYGFHMPSELLWQLDPLQQMVLQTGRKALNQCHASPQILEKTGVVLAAIALPTERASQLAWEIVMKRFEKHCHAPPDQFPFNTGPEKPITHTPFTPTFGSDTQRGSMPNASVDAITAMDAIAAGMVSTPAALLARTLRLKGGCFTLDAACASSLYAIKMACDQLHTGKTDMMIAGGVSRPDPLYTQIGFTQLKALSPSGRCAPFDKHADGLVVGEGAGLVVLKRLEDAIQCGDTIHGVIAGCGWSNDIEGNLVAPASEGQIRAMAMAYHNAGWSPADVQHIECHGSATPVGDNVELNSMATLWHNAGLGNQGCAIGSIKSMTGHLLTAAGAAGFIKTLLAMNEKTLPPSLNYHAPTDQSPLKTTGFHVQTEPEQWIPQPLSRGRGNGTESGKGNNNGSSSSFTARRAGVSAFGFGGINAHILVEEYRKSSVTQAVPAGYSIPSNSEKKSDFTNEPSSQPMPIAIVGMACITKSLPDLKALKQRIASDEMTKNGNGHPPASSISNETIEDDMAFHEQGALDLFMDKFVTHAGEFHIPPNQIADILPQHLILLKAAMAALQDAGIPKRPGKDAPERTTFGAAIGIDFDYGATDFHLRWREKRERLYARRDASETIAPCAPSPFMKRGPEGEVNEQVIKERFIDRNTVTRENSSENPAKEGQSITDHVGPLTHNRTLGALGGIVASRVAREFKLGGPCFTLSAGAESGMKALEIAISSLQSKETDTFLCGCVDMAGDLRQHTLSRTLRQYAQDVEEYREGIIPSEGAGAMLLKPLDKAREDGDRIYAVIEGCGTASASRFSIEHAPSIKSTPFLNDTDLEDGERAYLASLNAALIQAECAPADLTHYHLHGSGDPMERTIEVNALRQKGMDQTALSVEMTASNQFAGDTHTSSGMLSLIHGALSIHSASLKRRAEQPPPDPSPSSNGHGPKKRPYLTCIAAMTPFGSASHVILGPPPSANLNAQMRPHHPSISFHSESPKETKMVFKAHRFPADVETIPAIKAKKMAPHPGEDCLNNPIGVDYANNGHGSTGTTSNESSDMSLADNRFQINTAADAHMKFLELSEMGMLEMEQQYRALTALASATVGLQEEAKDTIKHLSDSQGGVSPLVDKRQKDSNNAAEYLPASRKNVLPPADESVGSAPQLLFDKAMCMEFAVGLAGNVLGETFEIIDTYPVRVRLPAAPLMLVDRILSIDGEMGSLSSGKIVTEHDVLPGAWYLDGDKAPVSISIEAGQADLFLSSYLGIDHAVKGKRRYRLLDAKVTFHRTLPEPGETITYHIEIDRFLKQGEIYLFFFHYKGYIGKALFISMRDGCAGFFTPEEVENSGGIILKTEDKAFEFQERGYLPPTSILPSSIFETDGQSIQALSDPKAPRQTERYDDHQVEALRRGDLESAFGQAFQGLTLGRRMRLPGDRMHLIDRVLEFNPVGGRFGLGFIAAEADIRPDAWFLTCHFVDDMVMPGTLMYECCAHALRIFTLRMGWISLRDDCRYDIIPGIESDLKCRGPVTKETKKARYEIEIKAMGFTPEPYVIADAHMFSDDHRIVLYKNMGMKIEGLSHEEIADIWDFGNGYGAPHYHNNA